MHTCCVTILLLFVLYTEYTCSRGQASLQRISCIQPHVLQQEETEEQLSRFSHDEERSAELPDSLPLENG